MHPEITSSKSGKCPKCGMEFFEKTANKMHVFHQISSLYTCPMDPDVTSERSGTCPKCGMGLVPLITNGGNHSVHEGHQSVEEDFKKRFFLTLPLVLMAMLLSSSIQSWFHFSLYIPFQQFVLFLIGTIIFLVGGIPLFKAAKGELQTKNPGMMTLVVFAMSVGYTFSLAATFFFQGESLYWEIATLISVFLLGHWLEMRSVRGATSALSALARLIPQMAHRVEKNATKDVLTETLQVGDIIIVRPGEKMPIDGAVMEGESSMDEALLTGESRPVAKKKGDKVIGGSINQDGTLTVRVEKTGKGTALSQIIELVRDAQKSKPQVQLLADKAAGILFYVAILAGFTSFLFWFFVIPQGVIFAATVAVSAIVVACPHALGLAIPTVTTITATLAAKNGIFIKDMKALEIARKINIVMFDKTGTLTEGIFAVDTIQSSHKNISKEQFFSYAASVESNSQHNIAQGIVRSAKEQKIKILPVTKFLSYPGKGAEGIINNKKILVGNRTLFSEKKITIPEIKSHGTEVFVAVHSKYSGFLTVSDVIRPESKEAVQKLHSMGIRVAMLTGDTKDIAEKIGQTLGIDTIFSHVLPEEKVKKVKELQKKNDIVAMVGDGVNDAPSLTQAHVGIAIGAGTDVATQSAGIVLMKNNPLDVVKAISLSRKTNRKMVENLLWATGYNVLAIPLAAGVLYMSLGLLLRPEWSALLMSASSIIVVLNALLLRREKL